MSIVLKLEVLLTKLNVMKKKVLFSVVFALMGLMGMAQDLKDLYPAGAEAVITPLPFDCAKGTPYSNPVPIDGAKVKGLPFYSYRDLNGTLKIRMKSRLPAYSVISVCHKVITWK